MLTPAGENALQDAFDTIIELETELERLLGRDGLLRLRRALRRIAELPLPALPLADRRFPKAACARPHDVPPEVRNGPAKDTDRRQS